MRVKSKSPESEHYLSASNRITGVVIMVIGLIGLLDIVLEWRTLSGLLVACIIGLLMVLTYVGLFRPTVTLSPEHLVLRNHVRDHVIPWSKVTGADVTDTLRVHAGDNRFRAPGVQLVMRDLRKQRVGGRKLSADSSISRADFVVDRIETHMAQYGEQSEGQVVTRWARPELIIAGALAVVALLAAVLR
ncbi:PH (Pleckstrin Homology) domain-containing protein [Kribbella antiqua]|uniref:PH (Pleckstrin Homology) domain-containing protein n=1 Tax=Kribbella antiqua TaxID=2512217 RepID=A0A4R2IRT9_9ACTN|nr:PH (Pleckstrin Homology) domain-containing protein [Kribbella antiqua]